MTTKRRHIGARNLQVLSVAKESYLRSGAYLLPPLDALDAFEDEDEAQASWAYHRQRLLADWNTAGRRPWALWAYDLGLAQLGSDFEWPEPYTTQSELVHAMLKAAKLEPCRLDGANRLEHGELAEIEADWRHAIHVALQQTIGCPQVDPFPLTEWRGVPRWYFSEHAPALRVEIAAERSAWRRSIALP